MAINKNAHLRYLVIDRCLRNKGKNYTLSDLTAECNLALEEENGEGHTVTERQVRKDIEFLIYSPEIQAPIEKRQFGHKKYYYYDDDDFSIAKAPMTQDEVVKIREALNMLNRFRGMPQFSWIEEIIARMESKMYISKAEDSVIGFEEPLSLESVKFLEPIFEAIVNKTPLKINYKPFDKTPIQWIIHPYYLKQYNSRWFLIGQNDAWPTSPLTTIPLDRIIDIEISYKEFLPNTQFDFKEYFDDIVGVSIPPEGRVEKIVFKMSPSRVNHVRTKPLHLSQKHLKNINNDLFEISVIPNQELYTLLLSFGNDLEVIEPESIRQEMRRRVKALFEIYS